MNLKHLLTNLNPFAKKPAQVVDPVEPNTVVEVEEGPEPINNNPPKPKRPGNINGKAWVLSETDKQMIVSMWAMGLTPSEVVERARMELNIEISPSLVHGYSQKAKWQPLIKRIREKHFDDIASVAGSHKKVRLQRSEHVYDKAIGKNKLDIALKAVESQRKEMEDGAAVHLTLNQFNNYSDDELKMKHLEVMKKISTLDKQKGTQVEQPTNQADPTGS